MAQNGTIGNIWEIGLNLLITPSIRWLVYILNVIMVIIAYNQEIVRYSEHSGFTGLPFNWQMFVIVLAGVFGSFLTFMGLWLTIPFMSGLPFYWYIPIFILLCCYYLQNTMDLKAISASGGNGDEFVAPPTYLLPRKYRMAIVYLVLILDIIIFIQYYIYFGVFDYSKDTYLHRYLLERFGGWYDGRKLHFVIEWLGIGYIVSDLYNIYLQTSFEACKYGLPVSWNF
jgi:hypothetical protein